MNQATGQLLGTTPHPVFSYSRRWWTVLGLALAVAALVWLLIWTLSKPKAQPTTTTKIIIPKTISTPSYYRDFVGVVVAIKDNVVTIEHGVSQGDKVVASQVQVTVDPQTIIKSPAANQAEDSGVAIKIDRLQVKDHIHVFGSDNLANKTGFTATKLIRLAI
jgi:hypothetical protein